MTTFLILLAIGLLYLPASYLAQLTTKWRKEQNLRHDMEDSMTWLMNDPDFNDTPLFVETVVEHSFEAAQTLEQEWKEINTRDAAQ